jgi:hypothetical protein
VYVYVYVCVNIDICVSAHGLAVARISFLSRVALTYGCSRKIQGFPDDLSPVMSTAFSIFVNIMVPLSAVFLFLLVLPFPQRMRRGINSALTKIFLLPGPLGMPTISSVLLMLAAFFVHVSYQLYDFNQKFSRDVAKHEPPKVSLSEHRLVRSQRNFWVGLLLMVFWLVLSLLLRLSKKIVEQEAELATYRAGASRKTQATSAIASGAGKSGAADSASQGGSSSRTNATNSGSKHHKVGLFLDGDEDSMASQSRGTSSSQQQESSSKHESSQRRVVADKSSRQDRDHRDDERPVPTNSGAVSSIRSRKADGH